jgi:hypothetical protein
LLFFDKKLQRWVQFVFLCLFFAGMARSYNINGMTHHLFPQELAMPAALVFLLSGQTI